MNDQVEQRSACAHINVRRFQLANNGRVFDEQWRCAECGLKFYTLPEIFPPAYIEIMPPIKTLRDEFAMSALIGMLSSTDPQADVSVNLNTAQEAYKWADAMLETRK